MRYQSAEHELDHRHLDESASGACKTFIVAGEAAASAEPSECALDDPATRQNLEAAGGIGAFNDLKAPDAWISEQRVEPFAEIGAIGPNQPEPRIEAAQAVEHDKGAITVLDIGRMDNRLQYEALRIDEDVALAPFDLLARVITHRVDRDPPFSADLTDWLSMMPALGLASRSICPRSCSSSA